MQTHAQSNVCIFDFCPIITFLFNHDCSTINNIHTSFCRFAVETYSVECVPNTIVNCQL